MTIAQMKEDKISNFIFIDSINGKRYDGQITTDQNLKPVVLVMWNMGDRLAGQIWDIEDAEENIQEGIWNIL